MDMDVTVWRSDYGRLKRSDSRHEKGKLHFVQEVAEQDEKIVSLCIAIHCRDALRASPARYCGVRFIHNSRNVFNLQTKLLLSILWKVYVCPLKLVA